MEWRLRRWAIAFASSLDATPPDSDPDRLAPFAVPRASFFHAAIEVPPLLSARQLDAGQGIARLGSYHTRSDAERHDGGQAINFDGLYHDWLSFEAAWGATQRVELSGRVALSGWDEQLDRLEILDEAGQSLVQEEEATILGTGRTTRHVSVSDVTLYLRYQALRDDEGERDVSLGVGAKLPVGRRRDLNNAGTIDLAFVGYGGMPLAGGRLSGSAGLVLPLTDQNLFEDSADVDLDPLAHAAAALVWPLGETWAAGVQLEANTSPFRDVDVLDGPPVTVLVGVRKHFERVALEVGAGTGLDWDSSYQYQVSLALSYRFGASR